MLQDIKLKTRILAGFGLQLCVLLVVGLVGVQGVSRLGANLSYVLGPAWNTADGAMETSIEIQAEMLKLGSILQNSEGEQSQQQLQQITQKAEESIARMTSGNLIPAQSLKQLTDQKSTHDRHVSNLLQKYRSYKDVEALFHSNSFDFVELSEAIEELGDQAVEALEQNPELPLYWNQGLQQRWMAADGGMESNIGMLRQMYYLQRILSGDQSELTRRHLDEAIEFQEEASQDMFATGRFNGSAGQKYGNQSYREAYEKMFEKHKQIMAQLLERYRVYRSALQQYEDSAGELLTLLAEIEAIADETVEGTLVSATDTKDNSNMTMKLALVLGAIMSLGFGWLLTRQIMGSLNLFKDRIDDLVQGEGDLSRRLEMTRGDEFGQLARSLDQFFDKIHKLVRDVAGSVPHIAQSTQALLLAADKTGTGVEEQRMQTEQLSTAVYEMDETAKHVAENIESASHQAGEVNDETQHVHQSLQDATHSIERLGLQIDNNVSVIGSLNDAVSNINSVLEVITGIAEQTNLLALNAAIEAARAGEQGRGFAVVADEVRGLAARTQDSTGEIRRMIDDLRTKATEAVKSMDASRSISEDTTAKAKQSMETLSRISSLVTELNSFNRQVASAAHEQSQTTRSLTESIHSIQTIAETNSAQMTHTISIGKELEQIGQSLERQVRQFRL